MATTFFSLKPSKKKNVKPAEEKKLVELKLHKTKAIPESMTYIDIDGKIKNVDGAFSKAEDGSYFLTKTTSMNHDIYEKTESTYLEDHFSYIDSNGVKRVFNKLDTLIYDKETNTYTGLVEDIEYNETMVEVFVENKNNE